MGLDFHSPKTTRYLQVYDYYKDLIVHGKLEEGTKMPSIRRCCEQLGLSKTTIETAYLCLAADGYIIARPQSGYYVTGRAAKNQAKKAAKRQEEPKQKILYDFTSNNADEDSFDFDLWRRYIKSALRQDKRMLTYGESQGEYELRETICNYVINKRNAVCTPEQIVIGAGSQSLLNMLCPIIKDKQKVCFHDTPFAQGIVIFEDYGFEIVENFENADILYMTPSNMTSLGDVMSVEKRLEILKESASHNRLIIEDDYNNEFRYFTKPRPCLQGLAGGEHVVYLSTFSKLLLPSIRLSFMILPYDLLPLYQKKKALYNQTASKVEQLALCQFLRDGHLDAQIRKLKRLYSNKTKQLCYELEQAFGKNASISTGESVSMVHVKLKSNLSNQEFCKKALQYGIKLIPSYIEEKEYAQIALSTCEVPSHKFSEAVSLLKQIKE